MVRSVIIAGKSYTGARPTEMARAFAREKDRQYANPVLQKFRPYVGLVTAHDNRVRPNHFALDYRRIKTVFAHDDCLWTLMKEPLGRACRCTRLAFSEADLRKLGLQVGRGEDWCGREVEVTIPGSTTPVRTYILPDRKLPKLK